MKNITKMIVLTLLVAFAMTLGVNTTSQAASGSVKSVKITAPTSKSTYSVNRKDANVTKQLKVTVKTKGKASKEVTYKSSNKSVVSVSSTGLLTFKKAGKATVTVTSKANKKKKDTVKITVNQLATSVKASVKKAVASYDGVYTIQANKSYTINKSVAPSKTSNKAVSYKTSNKKVVTVSSSGKLKGKKAGTATITVTSKDKGKAKTTFKVIVTKKVSKKVSKVTAVAKDTTLLVGTTTALTTTVEPAKATLKTLVFNSSNDDIATVDAKGNVKAVAPGKATITVKAMDGSKKSATVEITVKAAATDVTFAATTAKVYVNGTVTVKASTNADAFDTTVTYSIDKASQTTATVDPKTGVVKGLARGTVDVVATSVNNKTAICKVTVVDKTVTKVTPVEGKTATATVKFTGAKAAIEKDVLALLKDAGLANNSTKQVNVNDKAYTALYKDGELTFNGKKISEITKDTETVKVVVGGNAIKFVRGLQLAQFKSATYTYDITIGSHTFNSLKLGTPYMTLKEGTTTYSVYAESGSLYFVGALPQSVINDIEKDGAATADVMNN